MATAMRARHIVGLCLFLILTACAEGNSIYHNRPLYLDNIDKNNHAAPPAEQGQNTPEPKHSRKEEQARIITVDAKQRHLLAAGNEDGWRMCAEAAPDVFSAISASASLDADVTSRKGKAAAAIAESAATIERTQTINLLRESMYRTCERYLSGALTKASFVIQAARDQRTMLAVLAIEQLTRTARPPSTIISAGATNASVANADSAALIKQFADEKTAALKAKDAAKTAFDTAKSASDCDAITTAPTDATDLGKWTTCVTARQTLKDRTAEATKATETLDQMVAVGLAGGATTAGTATGPSSNGSGGSALTDTAITAVALAVKEIALNSGFDESLMFCVGYLSDDPQKFDPFVRSACLQMLSARFNHDEQLRGRIMRFNLAGQSVAQTIFRAPDPTDKATPVLRAYLTDATLTDAELQRRTKLAGDTAAQLGLILIPNEITLFIASGQALEATLLLKRLQEVETDAAGKAALAK